MGGREGEREGEINPCLEHTISYLSYQANAQQ